MMKRKVLRIGNASLAVSLPSEWSKNNKIKPGQEIEIEEEETSLKISIKRDSTEKEITIRIPKNEKFAKRVIYNPYLHGYNIINVYYDNPKHRRLIEKTKELLLGFDIIEQRKNMVKIQNMAPGIEESFNTAFKRLFNIAKVASKELIEALESRDFTKEDDIYNYEWMANKFYLFCKRLINTKLRKRIWELTALYKASDKYEEITDCYRDIYKDCARRKKVELLIIKWLKELDSLHNEFYELYVKPSTKKSLSFARRVYELQESFLEEIKSSKATWALIRTYDLIETFRVMGDEIINLPNDE